jgi:mannose-1-phosphate guanylyltransferase
MPLDLDKKHSWAVVLAGGDGTRLQALTQWVSGDARPKQFCPFFGEKSLLNHTRERIAPLFHEEQSLFALARAHERFYQEQLEDVHAWRKVVQPSNRGTAVAMVRCLRVIERQDDDAVVAFFPSDHHYLNGSAFRETVACGLNLITEYPSSILILGAEARSPETEYGWIQPGRTLVDSLVNPLQRVSRFWEKPELPHAEILQRQGCLWNTFVTIGYAGAFLELLQATVPELTRALDVHSPDRELDRRYERIASIDFSRAVLTRVPKRLLALRDRSSGWTDFGSPRRVLDVLSRASIRPAWLLSSAREYPAFLSHGAGTLH